MNGKLGLVVEASVCWGLGARGKCALEVNAVQLVKFLGWFAYQLERAQFTFLTYVADEAFRFIQYAVFLAIEGAVDVAQFIHRQRIELISMTNRVYERMLQSNERTKLAERILADRILLRNSTPETKGMLLYALTRHGLADVTDTSLNLTLDPRKVVDRYAKRKAAVIKILNSVKTYAEWNQVCKRLTKDGAKAPNGLHYKLFLKDYLDEGQNRSDEFTARETLLRSLAGRN